MHSDKLTHPILTNEKITEILLTALTAIALLITAQQKQVIDTGQLTENKWKWNVLYTEYIQKQQGGK